MITMTREQFLEFARAEAEEYWDESEHEGWEGHQVPPSEIQSGTEQERALREDFGCYIANKYNPELYPLIKE